MSAAMEEDHGSRLGRHPLPRRRRRRAGAFRHLPRRRLPRHLRGEPPPPRSGDARTAAEARHPADRTSVAADLPALRGGLRRAGNREPGRGLLPARPRDERLRYARRHRRGDRIADRDHRRGPRGSRGRRDRVRPRPRAGPLPLRPQPDERPAVGRRGQPGRNRAATLRREPVPALAQEGRGQLRPRRAARLPRFPVGGPRPAEGDLRPEREEPQPRGRRPGGPDRRDQRFARDDRGGLRLPSSAADPPEGAGALLPFGEGEAQRLPARRRRRFRRRAREAGRRSDPSDPPLSRAAPARGDDAGAGARRRPGARRRQRGERRGGQGPGPTAARRVHRRAREGDRHRSRRGRPAPASGRRAGARGGRPRPEGLPAAEPDPHRHGRRRPDGRRERPDPEAGRDDRHSRTRGLRDDGVGRAVGRPK